MYYIMYIYTYTYFQIFNDSFCPKKLLPSQASELTAGNLGGHCKTPDEV